MQTKTVLAIAISILAIVVAAAVVAAILLSKKQSSSPLHANYFGCKNGKCRPGQGSQTYAECHKTCSTTPTSHGYGCNPKTGQCEIGYGTDDSTCSQSSPCKKLTYKCDQTTWQCMNTNEVTNTSQDNCDCDPRLTTTPIVRVDAPPQFPNGKGTYCALGFYNGKDEYGQDQYVSCEHGACCESNYCGSFQAADPSDETNCAKAKDKNTCTQYASLYGCQWSDKDGCTAIKNEVGQCAPCTSDADCKTISDNGTCSAAGKCQLSGFKCTEGGAGTEYRTVIGDMGTEVYQKCRFPQPVNPCVNETDAYTCGKTMYTAKCQDRNGLDWATTTQNCYPQTPETGDVLYFN